MWYCPSIFEAQFEDDHVKAGLSQSQGIDMAGFHNFSTPVREIFVGNLLLLLCSLFYLIWWIVSYRPNSYGLSATGGIYFAVTLISGIAAIAVMSFGIKALSVHSDVLAVKNIWIGVGLLFLAMLAVTTFVFHRVVTSELILVHIWMALELSAVIVLYGTRRFGVGIAVTLVILIAIATIVGLICYVLYYRLDETASYWNGMIPLIADALVMTVFLMVLVKH